MQQPKSFAIGATAGYTPYVGRLVWMMNDVRWRTEATVENLTIADLDYLHDSQSNTIGALLLHIAATEVQFQRLTLTRASEALSAADFEAAIDLGRSPDGP